MNWLIEIALIYIAECSIAMKATNHVHLVSVSCNLHYSVLLYCIYAVIGFNDTNITVIEGTTYPLQIVNEFIYGELQKVMEVSVEVENGTAKSKSE